MLIIDSKTCYRCAGCISLCPDFALFLGLNGLNVRLDECSLCEICVEFCPLEALRIQSGDMQADEGIV